MNIESKNLMCVLNSEEIAAKAAEIVTLYKAVADLDMQKKRLSNSIKGYDEDIQGLLEIIDNKAEDREVDCQWIFDWDTGVKRLIRLDTGALVENKAIEEWEKQQWLKLERERTLKEECVHLEKHRVVDWDMVVCGDCGDILTWGAISVLPSNKVIRLEKSRRKRAA